MNRRNFLKAIFIAPLLAKDEITKTLPQIPSLFLQLQKIHELELENEVGFKNIYLAGDENTEQGKLIIQNSKTIILVGDIHIKQTRKLTEIEFSRLIMTGFKVNYDETWKIELKQVEILKTKFNINFIEIEGWAGHKIDKIRGIQSLNGEIHLIKYLLNNSNFNLVGLEYPEIQLKSFDIIYFLPLYYTHIDNYKLLSQYFIKFSNNNLVYDFITELEVYIYDSKINPKKVLTKKMFSNLILKHFKELDINNQVSDILETILKNLIKTKETYELFNIIPSTYLEIKKHQKKLSKIYMDNSKLYPVHFESNFDLYSKLRSNFAAKKMLEEMKIQNEQIGVIVFGKAHLAEIQKELIKLTNGKINIYIAK